MILRTIRAAALAASLSAACTGAIRSDERATGGPGAMTSAEPGATGGGAKALPDAPEPAGKPSCTEPAAPAADWATFRQLTRHEHMATTLSLAEMSVDVLEGLPSDGATRAESGVPSNALTMMNDQRFASFSAVAARVAAALTARLDSQRHCVITSRTTTGCLDAWVAALGKRAFRRPLTADEKDRLVALNLGEPDPIEAAKMVVEALMLSPQFLFHVELGERREGNRVALGGHEIAARLAYFVTGAPPAADLMQAADAGELDSAEALGQWAAKLLRSASGRAHQVDGLLSWLGIENLEATTKSPDLFPELTTKLKTAMTWDARRAIEEELMSGARGFGDWLSSDRRYFGSELAFLYADMAGGATRRVGPFMQPAWLTKHSGGKETAPTRRGKFLVERVLCQPVPPPPANLVIPPVPENDGTLTTRERFESHGTLPCAAGCHGLMDPLGFAFESYDPMGRQRTTENGKPIDTKGTIRVKDVTGSFQDGAGLMELIAKSDAFFGCIAEQWVERALAVPPRPQDKCETGAIGTAVRASGGTLESLIVGIARSPLFRSKGVCAQ